MRPEVKARKRSRSWGKLSQRRDRAEGPRLATEGFFNGLLGLFARAIQGWVDDCAHGLDSCRVGTGAGIAEAQKLADPLGHDPAVFIGDGLSPAFQIDDGQAATGETETVVVAAPRAVIVGSAVAQSVGHRGKALDAGVTPNPGDSAHEATRLGRRLALPLLITDN